MKDRYVAYDAYIQEFVTFPDLASAEEWLLSDILEDGCYAEEYACGDCYIAKITHETAYNVTDKKSHYHEHDDDCSEDCDEEEWPYDDEYDVVGDIVLKPVSNEK